MRDNANVTKVFKHGFQPKEKRGSVKEESSPAGDDSSFHPSSFILHPSE
jgi:hypothetical protein